MCFFSFDKQLNLVAKQRNEMLRAEFRRRIAQFETHQLLFIDESSKDDRTFQVKKNQQTINILPAYH